MPLFFLPTHTKTEICNHALSFVGSDTMTDFLHDDTRRGQLCRLFFDQSLEEVLEDSEWTFATRRLHLSLLQDTPPFGLHAASDKYYQLPEDFLGMVETDPSGAVWRVEGDRLVTDEPRIGIVYVAYQGDTSKLSAKFRLAVAANLAMKLAMPITRDRVLMDQMMKMYGFALQDSRHSDAKNASRTKEELDDLIRVRVER